MQDQDAPVTTLIEALRARTGALHGEAERAMDIMSPELTPAVYSEKLKTMYGFFTQLETSLRAHNLAVGQVPELLARLEKDLKFLTRETPMRQAGVRAEFLNELGDPHFRAGVFYVLEGSALGGQIVTKYLQEKLNIHPESGGAYFYGDGPATGKRWRTTLTRLGEWDGERARWEAVLNGAEQTFRHFVRMFRVH